MNYRFIVLAAAFVPYAVATVPTLPATIDENNERGCTFTRPNYANMTNAKRITYSNVRCEGSSALVTTAILNVNTVGDWSYYCSELCQDTPTCESFTKVFESTTTYRCRLYACSPIDADGDGFKFADNGGPVDDRSGWLSGASCFAGSPTNAPTSTRSPTLTFAPTSLLPSDIVNVETNFGCTIQQPDYPSFSTAKRQDRSQIRCSGDSAILTTNTINNGQDWNDECAFRCIQNAECYSFTKLTISRSSFQCRLYRCTYTDSNFFFAQDESEDDRSGWFTIDGRTQCLNSPTLSPTPSSLYQLELPTLTNYTNPNNCEMEYVDYSLLTTSQREDYSNIRCRNEAAITLSSAYTLVVNDWKDVCTDECRTTLGCKSFTRTDITANTFRCRLYGCDPTDSNFFFAANQLEDERSGWLVAENCPRIGDVPPPASNGRNISRPNIVIFIADDMSPFSAGYLSADHPLYGKTPRLETRFNIRFQNAFTPYPVCGPARAALLTSRHPDTLKIYNFDKFLMQVHPDIQTIPKYFKDELGYYTAGFGKVFHPHALGEGEEGQTGAYELMGHWSQPLRAYFQDGNSECESNRYYCTTQDETTLSDYRITTQFIQFVAQRSATPDIPFLAIVGFRRPHTNIAIPAGMQSDIVGDLPLDIDDYEPDLTSLAYYQCDKSGNTNVPIAGSWAAIIGGNRGSIRALTRTEYQTTLTSMRRYYYTAIKWIDTQLGRAMDAIDGFGMTNNTVMVFFGDHGWLIGEKKSFCKNTLYDMGVRVPLYMHIPEQVLAVNPQVVQAPVSLIDVFPTLIDLVNGTAFDDGTGLPLQGVSFYKTLLTGKERQFAAYSQYPRCQPRGETQVNDCVRAAAAFGDGSCTQGADRGRQALTYMGYSLRTKRYRYVEWRPFEEVRTGCERLTWDGLDAKYTQLEDSRWQMDAIASRTRWDIEPVETELYEYEPMGYFDKMTDVPQRRRILQTMQQQFSAMIQQKFNSIGGEGGACSDRGLLLTNGMCDCLEGFSGLNCEIDDDETTAPTTSPTALTTETSDSPTTIVTEAPTSTTLSPTTISTTNSPSELPAISSELEGLLLAFIVTSILWVFVVAYIVYASFHRNRASAKVSSSGLFF